MQYHEFMGQVQNRGRMATFEQAVAATRATLTTLAEHLAGGEPDNLAAQLPVEIGNYLSASAAADLWQGERFSLDDFFDRVAMRESQDFPTAIVHARAVLDVLKDAVSPGELRDVLSQLPKEFAPLFQSGSVGAMPPERK